VNAQYRWSRALKAVTWGDLRSPDAARRKMHKVQIGPATNVPNKGVSSANRLSFAGKVEDVPGLASAAGSSPGLRRSDDQEGGSLVPFSREIVVEALAAGCRQPRLCGLGTDGSFSEPQRKECLARVSFPPPTCLIRTVSPSADQP
jgi:hypothetical protein